MNNTSAAERTEIPAADFDFSTIKVGDEIILRYKVTSDGADGDGHIRVIQPGFGSYYFHHSGISAVIPAPKPKTLRERAIEAAVKAVPGEYEFISIKEGHFCVHALVDAVLAELEKETEK